MYLNVVSYIQICISNSILLDIKRIKLLLDFHVLSTIFSDTHFILNTDGVDQTTISSLSSEYNIGTLVYNQGQFFYYRSRNSPRPSIQIPINGIYYNFVNRMPLPCVEYILQMYNIAKCTF